jgi:N-ethylmaleimide reductase
LYNGTDDQCNFDQETGNKIIEDGDVDLVAYGKPYQTLIW